MAFRREEYVRACLRKAAVLRRLAAGIAAVGSLLFAAAWLYERKHFFKLWGIEPLPALVSAICLAGVAITLVVGEFVARPSDSDGP